MAPSPRATLPAEAPQRRRLLAPSPRPLLVALALLLALPACARALVPKGARGMPGRPAGDGQQQQQLEADDADDGGGSSKRLVFHHVYNINVGDPECVGHGDAGGAARTVEGGGGAVFTHRVVVPPVPCGNHHQQQQQRQYNEQAAGLLARVELLEGEVASLRALCSAPTACCNGGHGACGGERMELTGETVQRDPCSGRGALDPSTRACVCEPEWTGPDCTLKRPPQVLIPGGMFDGGCVGGCGGRGRCVSGVCHCGEAYTGPGCLIPAVQAQPCPQGSDGHDCPKAPEPTAEEVPALVPSSTVAPTAAVGTDPPVGGGGGGGVAGEPVDSDESAWESVLLSRLTIRTVTCVDKAEEGGQGGADGGADGGRGGGGGGAVPARRIRPPSSDEPSGGEGPAPSAEAEDLLDNALEDGDVAGRPDDRGYHDPGNHGDGAGAVPVSVVRVNDTSFTLSWEPTGLLGAGARRLLVRWWPSGAAPSASGARGGAGRPVGVAGGAGGRVGGAAGGRVGVAGAGGRVGVASGGEVTVPVQAAVLVVAGLREASEYQLLVQGVVGGGGGGDDSSHSAADGDDNGDAGMVRPPMRLSVTTASSEKFQRHRPRPPLTPHPSTATIAVPAGAGPSPAPGSPAAATAQIGLAASDVTATSFRVSWFPGELSFDSYTVRYRAVYEGHEGAREEAGGAAAKRGGAAGKVGGAGKSAGVAGHVVGVAKLGAGVAGHGGGVAHLGAGVAKLGGGVAGHGGGVAGHGGGVAGHGGGVAGHEAGGASGGEREEGGDGNGGNGGGDGGNRGDDAGWRELWTPAGARSAVVTELTEGALYEVLLLGVSQGAAARGGGGGSPPPPGLPRSPPLRLFTALQPLGALTVTKVSPTAARVTWPPPSLRVTGVRVTWYAPLVGGRAGAARSALLGGRSTWFNVTQLSPLTRYEVTVTAMRGPARSAPSVAAFTTGLDTPRSVRVSQVTPRAARLSWRPPLGNATEFSVVYEASNGTHEESQELRIAASAPWVQLTELRPNTRYNLLVTATSSLGGTATRSQPTRSHLVTAQLPYPFPRDCSQVLLNDPEKRWPEGAAAAAAGREQVVIYLRGDPERPLHVTCDMHTDGGGWTVFQRRQSGHTNFERGWQEYEAGFGEPTHEFWIGLRSLHALLAQARYELRVDLGDGEASAFAQYDRFAVGDADSLYRVRIGEYSGTAGDSLSYHHGRAFSTPDRDHDGAAPHCAEAYRGGWWYRNCHKANLNGRYGDTSHSRGVNWVAWRGHEGSLSFVEMKLRPHTFQDTVAKRRRRHGD